MEGFYPLSLDVNLAREIEVRCLDLSISNRYFGFYQDEDVGKSLRLTLLRVANE